MSSTKPYSLKIGEIVIQSLTIILLVFFLIDTKIYFYLSLQFFFAFSYIALILTGIVISWHWLTSSEIKITLSLLLMGVWGIFVLLHTHLVKPAEEYKVFYLMSGILYFFGFTFLFRKQKIKFEQLYRLFAWFAVVQAVVCLLQGIGLFSSGDLNYAMKGTFNNPNTTAMYLALAFPFFLSNVISKNKIKLHGIATIALFAAIVLLKCRTAYVGLVVVSIVFFLKNESIKSRWSRVGRIAKLCILITTLALLTGLFSFLYFQKKASADGRIFVWKVSLEMLKDNPLTGVGYGFFERDYNLSQAHYIQTQSTTTSEKEHARYVYMPYNDFLEHALEGGAMGFLLYALLMAWIVLLAVRSKRLDMAAIVLAYSVMMLINFAQQAIPVWVLFLTATAALTTHEKPLFVFSNKHLINWNCALALLIVFVFGMKLHIRKHAQEQLQVAIGECKLGNFHNAMHILDRNVDDAGTSEAYFRHYGSILIAGRKTKEACRILERATCYSSTPSLQLDLAFTYLKLGERDKAMERLVLVQNMVPTNKRAKELMRRIKALPITAPSTSSQVKHISL